MRRFARLELGEDPVPDETTIPRFRPLLWNQKKGAIWRPCYLTKQIALTHQPLLSGLGKRALVARRGVLVDEPLARGPVQELDGDAAHFIGRLGRPGLLERGAELGTLRAIADLGRAGLPKVLLG